ncbi:MAG: hemolysin III family protein [Bacteroidetes bacterium]|nr:hemolysin III family protein [Bacteroidota bacterium]
MESYNRHQEIVNGLTHAAGVLFGLAALPILPGLATLHQNNAGLIGSCVYGICFLLAFASSTFYHFERRPRRKKALKVFDHISIYFFIAGTYTPFLLVYVNNSFGMTLLTVLWVLTAAGVIFKVLFTGRFEIVSTIIYLAMGWIMVAGGRRFFDHLPHEVVVLVFVGAGLYSIGVFFYLWDKYLYTHAVWHVFVLAAAMCHYVAVFLAM